MARDFTPFGENVDLGVVSALDGPSSFWVSVWLFMDTLTADGGLITNFDGTNGFLFFFDDANPSGSDRIDFFIAGQRVSSSAAVTVATWNNWLAQYDDAADELRLYKDAVLDNTTTGVTVGPAASGVSLILGNSAAGDASRRLDGVLANARAGLGVLDLGQIKDLVHRGAAGISTEINLPLWGDSPEPDLSGNGNNGTVTGATVADNPPVGLQFGFDERAYRAPAVGPSLPTGEVHIIYELAVG